MVLPSLPPVGGVVELRDIQRELFACERRYAQGIITHLQQQLADERLAHRWGGLLLGIVLGAGLLRLAEWWLA